MPLEQFEVWIAQYGYAAIFFLLVLGIVGLPVPDETLLTLTGYLVYRGTLDPVPSFICAFLGTSCGISLSYAIGRYGGAHLLNRFGRRLHITPEGVDRVHMWFTKWGHWSLTIGYFVPGVRHVIAIVAGSSRLELRTFGLFAYSGAFLWAGLFISAGYSLGEGWEAFPELMGKLALWGLAVLVAGLVVFWAIRASYRRKGR